MSELSNPLEDVKADGVAHSCYVTSAAMIGVDMTVRCKLVSLAALSQLLYPASKFALPA